MLSLILSRRDFRESDQIVSLYTKEKGKIKALARGVKKITSKNAAHLEPFSLVEAEIIPGKELARLGAVQPINYFVNIRADLQKSLAAGYVASLLDKVLHPGEKDERIFSLTVEFLEYLNLKFVTYNLQLMDSYIVKLSHCLGFDMTETEDLDKELKKNLEDLRDNGWQQVTGYKLQVTGYQKLHDFIYQFFIFQIELNVKDWLNLAKF